jgi:hypothetical protein
MNNFKVGDKVVPFQKSKGKSFEESRSLELAKNIGQKFLYVYMIDGDNVIWCSVDGNQLNSEAFDKTDLNLYVGDFYNTEHAKYEEPVLYNLGFILKLLKDGILKEDDMFIMRRV